MSNNLYILILFISGEIEFFKNVNNKCVISYEFRRGKLVGFENERYKFFFNPTFSNVQKSTDFRIKRRTVSENKDGRLQSPSYTKRLILLSHIRSAVGHACLKFTDYTLFHTTRKLGQYQFLRA